MKTLFICITEQHDLRLVALAAVVCLFACFTSANLFVHALETTGRRRLGWVTGSATVFGCGVWATHFIAELAYRPGIAVGYEIGLTILSIVIAVAATWLGMSIALHYRAPAIGGGIVGMAVGGMHYVGMAAVRVPADLHWDFAFVAASLAIGIALAAVAMRVLWLGAALRYRIAGALLLVVAIVGLHFTAMAAVVLEFNPLLTVSGQVIAPELLAITIAAVTVLIITLGLSGSIVDDQLARNATREAELLARRVAERTAELHEVQDELLRRERLSTLGQLTSTMAHEMHNPLSAINISLYTIKEMSTASGLDLERPILRIERSIARCNRIINDLLEYTCFRKLECAPVEADRWLDRILDDQTLPAGVVLVRSLASSGRRISCDGERLRRAIVNLIDNAVQALAEAAPRVCDRQISVGTHDVNDQLELTIEDTGPGIPPDVLARIFEPLFSTKSFGTGLGLPLVKQIVEQHEGSVEVTSEPGCGTRAVVRLPWNWTESATAAAA